MAGRGIGHLVIIAIAAAILTFVIFALMALVAGTVLDDGDDEPARPTVVTPEGG